MYIKAYLKIAPLHIFLVVLMIFFVFFVPNSFAQAITVTATGPTTFTIKIQNVHSWRIEERVGGQWGTLRTGWGSSASYSYTRPGGSYEFRLYNCYPVTNGCSTSTPKFVILEGNTPPNVPTVTSRVELGGIRVNWTLPANATSYRLSRGSTILTPQGASYFDQAVSPGNTYTYSVAACNANNLCSTSGTTTISYPATPAAPVVTSRVSGSSVVVSWLAVSGAINYKITKGSTTVTQSGTSYSDTQVTPGNSYSYAVRACNVAGVCSSTSSTTIVVAPVPIAPTVTTNFDGASVLVNWNSPTSATSFQVQRNGTDIATTGNAYRDESINAGSTYIYAVKACNKDARCSAATSASVAIPQSPLFSAEITGIRSFSVVVGNVYEWRIEEQQVDNSWVSIESGGATNRKKIDFNRIAGLYRLRLYNCYPLNNGCSTSTIKTVLLEGDPPAVPTPNALMNNAAVVVSWNQPLGATSYKLQRVTSSIGINYTKSITGTSFSDSDVTPGTTYTYHVRACNSLGECSALGTASIVATPGWPLLTVPATDIDGNFVVKWSRPVGSTTYVLQSRSSSGNWGTIYTGDEVIYPAIFEPGQYQFQIKACTNNTICSEFRESSLMTVTGSTPKTTRRVVFIHSDLLGSPAAETNEQGNENE